MIQQNLSIQLFDSEGKQHDHSVAIKRHKQATKLKLRINRSNSQISLTMPPTASIKQAQAFLNDSHHWLQTELENSFTPIVTSIGTDIPLMGTIRHIQWSKTANKKITLDDDAILIPEMDPLLVPSRLKRWMYTLCRHKIEDSLLYHTALMKLTYRKTSIGDMTSRWGSCSSTGDLKFNFRLIMAAPHLLDYVVIHELAHRRFMDHSPKFWALVAAYCPDYKIIRQQLKKQSPSLQRYQFSRS